MKRRANLQCRITSPNPGWSTALYYLLQYLNLKVQLLASIFFRLKCENIFFNLPFPCPQIFTLGFFGYQIFNQTNLSLRNAYGNGSSSSESKIADKIPTSFCQFVLETDGYLVFLDIATTDVKRQFVSGDNSHQLVKSDNSYDVCQ